MDGVDLACCRLSFDEARWHYKIVAAETIPYSDMWKVRLLELPNQSAEIFPKTHAFYGRYLGQLVRQFIDKHRLQVDFVASHGHTIFHQPQAGFTAQIGDGAALSATCGLPVVCDFRSMDLALGGQGAPLVPVGDSLLFAEYDACLNLGGISNISFTREAKALAYDISPCNLLFNPLAQLLNLPYDAGGQIAASGTVHDELLQQLNQLPFYTRQGAKSLGREWIDRVVWPLLQSFEQVSEPDKMATCAAHIAAQISLVLNKENIKRVLVTGGGAYNHFLIQKIQENTAASLRIPEPELLEFKEALIFALLGVLRIRNENNVWSSVTGSKTNHVAGALYGNFHLLT